MRVTLLSPVFRWYSVRNRRRKAEQLDETVRSYGSKTALVVGVGGNASPWEGIVERRRSDHAEVLATCDIAMKQVLWPFVQADGRFLPFRNDAVDLIVSNAVIEHVGDERDQKQFVEEHLRVAEVSFITTPNRWFPVESHTLVPLLHWSAKWRAGRKDSSITVFG
jgi:hypothetical protein